MATNPYGQRDPVYVNPFPNSGIKYGFLTSMTATEKGQLGHIPALVGGVSQAIFGINQPKPVRVAKVTAGKGHQSSFCDHTKLATAVGTQGWRKIKSATFKRGYPSKYTRSVFVTNKVGTNTLFFYAWRMPLWQFNTATLQTDMAKLGIGVCDPDQRNYVWGATKHQPPQAQFQAMPQNGRVRLYTTFVAVNKADNLPNGWTLKRQKNSNNI